MKNIPTEYKILAGIALIVIIGGVLLFKYGSHEPSVQALVDRPDAYTKGGLNAKVVLTEFGDFQCPACAASQSTVTRLMNEYGADLKLVFRHFPLVGHPLAQVSAEAAEAAGAQGRFWEMHDALYKNQTEWGDTSKSLSEAQATELFKKYGRDMGLDEAKFSQDMSQNAYRSNITSDMDSGGRSGVNATPTFFINGVKAKNPSYQTLKEMIDQALSK